MKIAVFKTGRHMDAAGHERDWSDADLDAIAAKYDPAQHEAPVVIGHPKENAPAYGWVEGLTREGDTLWAEIKPTVEQFTEWLKQGLFKKRSISLYPDLTLRHIGFLGATPPAVKGLPDFAFREKEGMVLEFIDPYMKSMQESRAGRHGIAIKDGGHVTKPGQYEHIPDDEFADPVNYRYPIDAEHIHAALAYWAKPHDRAQYSSEEQEKITHRMLAAAKRHGVHVDTEKFKFSERRERMDFWGSFKEKLAQAGMSFRDLFGSDTAPVVYTEAQVKAMQAEAAHSARETAAASFAEKEREFKAREDALKAKEAEARKGQVKEFVEGLKKKGIVIPAMEKLGMGITSFMQAVSEIGTTYEFSEDKAKKETPLEFMQAFLAGLPAQIEFKEVAEKDEVLDEASPEDEKRDKAIEDHMKAHKVPYKDAVFAVAKKHPEWFGHKRKGEK